MNSLQKLKSRFACKSYFGLAAIALLAVSHSVVADKRIVTLVGDPWPPYVEGRLGEDARAGIVIEIVYEIFAGIDNAEARFPLIPWQRALREVEAGYHDGIAMLLKTPERENYMVYSEPLLQGLSLVWSVGDANESAFEWNQLSDLEGLRIGVIDGYSYGEAIQQAIESETINVVRVPTVEHLFSMLANSRIDLALASEAVGSALVKNFPKAGIRSARRPTETETFYLAISKKSPALDLIPQINQQIQRLHDEGVIERIIKGL